MVLVIGLPNSGKTTYSNRFDNVLHYDEISSHPQKKRNLIYQRTVAECIEGIYNTRKSRENVLNCTNRSYNICIWIDTPKEECIKRENRGRPSALIEYHARVFEPPALDEGWDEIIIVRGDEIECISRKAET